MRRIPYRIVLPVIQLALYLVLVWYGCCFRPLWRFLGQDIGTDWCLSYRSVAEQIAIGINMPAELPPALILNSSDSRLAGELAEHVATALLIPVLWFFIGRVFDQRSTVAAKRSVVARWSAFPLLALSTLVTVAATASLIRHIEYEPVLHALILAWAIGGIMVSVRQIHHGPVRVATN